MMKSIDNLRARLYKAMVEDALANDVLFGELVQHLPDEHAERIPLAPDPEDLVPSHASFDKVVSEGHEAISSRIEAGILNGEMPIDVAVPTVQSLGAQAVELKAVYDRMQEAEMKPEIVFSPSMFSLDGWNALLKGYRMPYRVAWSRNYEYAFVNRAYRLRPCGSNVAETSMGLVNNWILYNRYLPDYSREITEEVDTVEEIEETSPETTIEWEVSVVSGKNQPPYPGVSADGYYGRHDLKAARTLTGLDPAVQTEQAINLLSPKFYVYNALQWMRLKQGRLPVDIASRTLLREHVEPEKVCNAAWQVALGAVALGTSSTGEQQKDYGLRLTVCASDLKYFS